MNFFDYDVIYGFENLYQAHRMAKRGKRYTDEVMRFEFSLSQELTGLQYELKHGIYRIRPYRPFMVYDPKERVIFAPEYRDRVVQHSLCDNIIEPMFDRRLIYDNAASRKEKGTHFAMDRLTGFLREHYRFYGNSGYILKCDIRKYFDSIDHRIMYDILKDIGCLDDRLMWLIRMILGSYHTERGKGLPLGNQTSQWFALIYLDRMDRIVKEKLHIKYYSRYMDDCVLVHHDNEYLKYCLEVMSEHVQKDRKLEFNQKTQITPISQGVDYLGFHFYLTDTGKVIRRLRARNKMRMKRKLKRFRKAYTAGKIDLEAIKRSLASYNGHLSHGHTYALRKNISRNFVLHSGKTGKR